jgi:chemotaxis response regulator CheB
MENQRELTVLLIEDDQFACEEIRNYIDQLDDMHLLGITDDSNKALDMVQYCIPDAIILDLLENAIIATKCAHASSIELSLQMLKGTPTISVSDSGIY